MLSVFDKNWRMVIQIDDMDIVVDETFEIGKPRLCEIRIPNSTYNTLIPNGWWMRFSKNSMGEPATYVVESYKYDYQMEDSVYTCYGLEHLILQNVQIYSIPDTSRMLNKSYYLYSYFPPINIGLLLEYNMAEYGFDVNVSSEYTDDDRVKEEGLFTLQKLMNYQENHGFTFFVRENSDKSLSWFIFKKYPSRYTDWGKIDTLVDFDSITWGVDETTARYRMVPNWNIDESSDTKIDTWRVISDYYHLGVNPGDTRNNGAYIFTPEDTSQDPYLRWKITNRTCLFTKPINGLIVRNDFYDTIVNFYNTNINMGGVSVNNYENCAVLDTSIQAVKYDRDATSDKPALHIYETRPQDVYFEIQEKLIADFKESAVCEVGNIPQNLNWKLGDKISFTDPLLNHVFELRVEKIEKTLGTINKNKFTLKLIIKEGEI